MTEQERYDEMLADIAALTLSEAEAADDANTLFSWLTGYWNYVENGTPPSGQHPPHKPPF